MSIFTNIPSDPSEAAGGIWNVPYLRNPYFSGREEELSDLRKSLAGSDPRRRVQGIWGLAGVGKSQLALEYVYRFRDEYRIVWWLNAEEPSNLALTFARLATRLGMDVPEGAPLDDIRQATKKALAAREDWLIVFDNASGVEDVRPYLPPERTGHVIITSRNPNWDVVGRPFALRPMKRNEAVDFLLKRTGKKKMDGAVGALAQALGDLPLALEQAGACISQTRTDFSSYLHEFEGYWGELLREVRPTGDYPDSVHMTWELACRQVVEESPQGAALMNLLAYLGAESVPRELLRDADGLPESAAKVTSDPQALEAAIATLTKYSLIRDDGHATSMHRLVGNLVRDRLPENHQKMWAEAAIKLIGDVFKFDSQDLSTWDYCATLLPHAIAAAFHAEANRVSPRATVDVLENGGRYLLKRAQYDQSKELLERALAQAHQFYGETHPRVSALANTLGRIHRQMGNLEEAKHCFERSLSIDSAVYGESDPHAASVYNNLGVALHEAGDAAGAKKQFEWALQVFENTYGADHPKIAQVVNNLGYVLTAGGDLEGARAQFERAVDVARLTYGENHPTLASIYTNQGIVLRALGDVASAKALFERALEIHEQAHGEDHPQVARDAAHLGLALQELGLREAALEQFERALKIDRTVFGEQHLSVAFRLSQLGRLLLEMDNEPAARRCFTRAAAIQNAVAKANSATMTGSAGIGSDR